MQAEAATLTGTEVPDVQRIPVEGKRITPVRNVPRIVLEIETAVPMTLQGNFIRVKMLEGGEYVRTKARIEIYVDKLAEVMRQYRTEKHEKALAMAELQRDNLVQNWRDDRKREMSRMTSEERERHVRAHCLIDGTAEHLRALGYKTGIPNLLSVKVVSQQDHTKMVDAEDWGALTDTEKAEFVGVAPASPENATEQSMRMIAEVLSRAMGNASAANTKTPAKK